jgi:hypothetical protein
MRKLALSGIERMDDIVSDHDVETTENAGNRTGMYYRGWWQQTLVDWGSKCIHPKRLTIHEFL